MQITLGVSSGFHSLDFVMLSYFTKKIQNFWKLPPSPFFNDDDGDELFLWYDWPTKDI